MQLCEMSYWAMKAYTIFPVCLGGAVVETENRDSRAALMAIFLRQESSEDTSSWTLAPITRPWLSTVMMTVTPPEPMHRYAGMDRWLAFRPASSYDTTDGPE